MASAHAVIARLQESARVRYDPGRRAFVTAGGVRCRGLTRVIARAWPLPRRHPVKGCDLCSGRVQARPARRRQALRPGAPVLFPTEHGHLVDRQLTGWANHGAVWLEQHAGPGGIDPAVRAVIRHITERRGWIPVAAQVPLHLGFLHRTATAIDLLCTDARTRHEVVLLEIKCTARRQGRGECYRAHGKRGGPLKSQHGIHQLQLLAMDWCLRHDYGIVPDKALVLRADSVEGRVLEYALCRETHDGLVPALVKAAAASRASGPRPRPAPRA